MKKTICFLIVIVLAACTGTGGDPQQALIPTDTLAPIVSMTPRFTATPIPTRTPLPTYTYTPSVTPITPTPSNTPPPTATPPVTGIIASLQSVNVREGPGVAFDAIEALTPGTGVQVLGQNEDGKWLNIRMENGREGWIATSLVRVNPVPTGVPTATPSPDLTALALGTELPTAIFGGGTITPTPPGSVVTATPPGTSEAATETPFELPVIDVNSIQQTATALANGGISLPTPSGATATFTPIGSTSVPGVPTIPVIGVTATPGGAVGGEGNAGSQQGVDVLAYCDNRIFGKPAPTNLSGGATIDVFWSWYVSEPDLMQQHLDNVIYEVRIDGVLLQDWRLYSTRVRQQADGNYYIYWFVPYGPLTSGQHTITYNVTWREQITDGYDVFGPGTNRPSESGTCTFTVS